MKEQRIFTFGCSLTNYYWPTWADIIGHHHNYQNWGIPGLGNQGIFYQLIEAGKKNQISKNDTVLIMWTFLGRQDRYVRYKWVAPGNPVDEYGIDWIEKYYCEKGSLIQELACMYAVQNILNYWGCKWKFLTVSDLVGTNITTNDSDIDDYLCALQNSDYDYFLKKNLDVDVMETYIDVLKKFHQPSLYNFLHKKYNEICSNKLKFVDRHPTPKMFLDYVNHLDEFKISKKTTIWVNEWDDKVHEANHKKDLRWNATVNRF
jgi:hypothetical protein